ncbi:MAG: YidC/Oxa1 family membrane protein insertase [Caloramator sp.]|nr:YidC/Oxa1 family membrane protein insertase [Caloramator sp.]
MGILTNVFNYLLHYLFNITGDWGIAIITLTLIVRVLLLPISIKQRINMIKQQNLSKKLNEIKQKYKNDANKLESEMKKYYEESAKSMFGCLISFIQIPIISTLYFTIMRMPIGAQSIIIPWVSSIKMPDKYYVVPFVYVLVSLSPNLLSYIEYFKLFKQSETTKSTLILNTIFSILITIKAPVAIGIYFITTGVFSFVEELIFRIYIKYW